MTFDTVPSVSSGGCQISRSHQTVSAGRSVFVPKNDSPKSEPLRLVSRPKGGLDIVLWKLDEKYYSGGCG